MERFKLGELIDVTRGASLAGDNYATEGELVRLTLGNFDYQSNGFKQNSSKDNIFYNGDVDSSYILEEGDIITPLTEQAIGLLGSTAKIPESGKYIQSQDVALVKVKSEKLVHDFAYYLLPTASVKKQLSAGAQQTSIRHTSPDKIKDCTVYIPDPTDQQKIADFLNQIDEKIAINKKENETLEAMAKQLYDYWFVQFDFPDANGRPYKTSGGKMVWNETLKREIPEGWEVKALSELSDNEMCSIMPTSEPDRVFKHFSIPAYDACGFYEEELGKDILSNKNVVTEHDVLVSKLNPWTSRVVWGIDDPDTICSTEYVSLRPKASDEKAYMFMIAKSSPFMRYCTEASTGTSHSHRRVNPDILRMYKVPYSRNCVKAFCDMTEELFNRITVNKIAEKELREQKDFILPLLMTGQVTIG